VVKRYRQINGKFDEPASFGVNSTSKPFPLAPETRHGTLASTGAANRQQRIILKMLHECIFNSKTNNLRSMYVWSLELSTRQSHSRLTPSIVVVWSFKSHLFQETF